MKKKGAISSCIKLGLIGVLCSPLFLSAKHLNTKFDKLIDDVQQVSITPDSIGTEIINNEIFIIHRVESKDTYYALGRRYGAKVNRILEENNKKNLKPGDTVKIPTGRRPQPVLTSVAPKDKKQEQQDQDPAQVLTEYKVGQKETLYTISKRFNTTVNNIKKMNKLTSDSVQEGQVLKIPDSDYRAPEPKTPIVPVIIDTVSVAEQNVKDLGFETNRYGIREKKEKGIGIWMENLETDGKSNLALHKSAPIGTILKITNPMTRNVTYAKVVGKFKETQETRDAIVVLSKSAASYIGALDRRFLIEIAYGVPLD